MVTAQLEVDVPDITVMVDWALKINYLAALVTSQLEVDVPDITGMVDWALKIHYLSILMNWAAV